MPGGKKRKINCDYDELERSLFLEKEICEAFEKINITNSNLDPEKIIGFAAIKLGFAFVENLLAVLKVVPEESGPWREEIASLLLAMVEGRKTLNTEEKYMLKMACHSSKFKSALTGQALESYYTHIFSQLVIRNETYCNTNFEASDQPPSTGAAALPWEEQIFAGCIAPPTKVCFVCRGNLQKHNKPSCVTYYLASGPLPILKVELRCRVCKLNYGISKFGNTNGGLKYYDRAGIVEASDAVYIDRLMMDMFASLR